MTVRQIKIMLFLSFREYKTLKIKDVITTVICTYNERNDLLIKQIESLLNQTYPYQEIIIVDDGCTDDTPNILKEYKKQDNRIKVFRRERDTSFRTVSEAFNIGLEQATGKWWHHDAADNYHSLDWAERCIIALDGRDDIIGCHTDFRINHYDGKVSHMDIKKIWQKNLSAFENYRRFESLGGTLFKMEAAKKAGMWDTRFPRKQTREWTLRVLQQGDLVHIPVELWDFVFHEIDQMKNIASIKYRLLGDLKNGYDLSHNILVALGSKQGKLSMLDAFKEFFVNPEWEYERKNNLWCKDLANIKILANKEASEVWVK